MPLPNPTEIRPWGSYQNLFEAEGYLVKIIEVSPGNRLSLQRHSKREEFWTVIEGSGKAIVNDREISLEPGGTITIGCRDIHRIINNGDVPLLVLELQKGECREDDIERLEDDYNRAPKKRP